MDWFRDTLGNAFVISLLEEICGFFELPFQPRDAKFLSLLHDWRDHKKAPKFTLFSFGFAFERYSNNCEYMKIIFLLLKWNCGVNYN